MNRFRFLLFIVSAVLLVMGFNLSSAIQLEGREELSPAYHPDNLIRLRIMPHSNLEQEQELKLLIRDRLLEETRDLFLGVSSKGKAQSILKTNIHRIKALVVEFLNEQGVQHESQVQYQELLFPRQNYGEISLPPGFYPALQVTIGEGQGDNWWCVLFPPLCFMESVEEVVLEDEKRMQMEKEPPVEFRFRLLTSYPRMFDSMTQLYQWVMEWDLLNPRAQAIKEIKRR